MVRMQRAPWLEPRLRCRLTLEVGAARHERLDRPVEVDLDLAQSLSEPEATRAWREGSWRVVEVGARGELLDDDVPFQLDAAAPGRGVLIFLLRGVTLPDAVRRFQVYFDPDGSLSARPRLPALVQVADGVEDEGQECFEVRTPDATYLYQKQGAGFSSLLDRDGNDWIGYHPQGGSAGHYRGIPNLGECGHPGYTNSWSRLESCGPLRARIHSETLDGRWAFAWDIFPHYARLTLLRAGGRYWFLYEGTPGGQFDEQSDYCVRSTGQRTAASEVWDEDIPAPEWVYFGSGKTRRVLYLIHHEDDDLPDQYWPMEGNMTVFGFGRRYGSLERFMEQVPAHFTVGFAEDGALPVARRVIESALRELDVRVGPVEDQGRSGG